MHCRVINVGGVCILGQTADRLSKMFLLVANVMLRNSNYARILNALNSLFHRHAGKDWIGTEACDRLEFLLLN
jgi:hypothetical protein